MNAKAIPPQKTANSLGETLGKYFTRMQLKSKQLIDQPIGALVYHTMLLVPIPGIDEELAEGIAMKADPNFKKISNLREEEKNLMKKVAASAFKDVMKENPGLRRDLIQYHLNQNAPMKKELLINLPIKERIHANVRFSTSLLRNKMELSALKHRQARNRLREA
ncbi:MAG: hypothetical protein ABH803_01715 [Candidatus Micrarchaeota archaeon]